MDISIIIILLSWMLNATADSIDHGKGAQTLYLLWHIIKWFNYAIPFAYIIYLTRIKNKIIIVRDEIIRICLLIISAFIIWEITYRFLRYIEFWKLDDIIKF